MKIFNSLGSNYNFGYVFRSIFSDPDNAAKKLTCMLSEKYGGKAILTYKGREALILALKLLNLPKDSMVAINGFTCYTVYKAIFEAGLSAICLDLDDEKNDLNFSVKNLEKVFKENKNIKAVVAQNTLGYPCNIEEIEKFCHKNNIFLIEDLAHCVGTQYVNGKEAGTVGDLTALSFSQDKVIDAVSGGALIIRNKKFGNFTIKQFGNINIFQQLKDRLYPLFTYKIRCLYKLFLGKSLHYILKKMDLLSKPAVNKFYSFNNLPDWYANLAFGEYKKLIHQLIHRREIARVYAKNLNKKILSKIIAEKIAASVNLRFPIFTKNREDLIKFLKNKGVFISDIWYKDVAPECPKATAAAKLILNLPTHINISKNNAIKIAENINEWLKIK
jgi:dTDP-4-amino-4,6-dideoxygalactose transaminase